MSVRKSMAWSLTGSVGFFVIQFAASVIVARLLTPAEFGVYGVALAAVTLLLAFQNLGFQSFIVREATLDAPTLGTVHTMAILQGAALAALLYAGAPALAAFLDEPRVTPALRILCLFAALTPVEPLASGHFQRRHRFDLVVATGLARVVVAAATSVFLAYRGFSYASLSWGSVAGGAAAALVGIAFAGRELAVRPTLARWRTVWAYGSNILATMALANIVSRLPDIILARLAGMATVGLYGRASGIIESFNTGVMYGVNGVVLKGLVDSREALGRIDSVYLRAVRTTTGLFWPMYAGLGILSGPVITMIYGPRWAAAAPVLALLCAAAVIQTALVARQEVLITAGRVAELPRLEGLRGAVGLTLFAAGATQGLVPAAAARVAEALTQHGLFVRRIRAAADTSFGAIYRCYGPSLVVTAAAVLPSLAVMQARGWPAEIPPGEMAAAILGGVALWFGALFAVGHELRAEIGTVGRAVAARLGWRPA